MKKRWFTLIEMLIVIVIIGILAGALIPRIWNAREKANDTAREANVRSIATAMVQLWLDAGTYPATYEDWVTLASYNIGAMDGNPAGTTYVYQQMNNWEHFIVYAVLSAWAGNEWWWNCNSTEIVDGLTYATASSWHITNWDSFCYFQ